MIRVFISYAREDEQIARELFRFLENNGYYPWLDKEKLVPGMDWEREIERAVNQSHLQIFVLSPRSIEKRGVFQREIRLALKKAEDLLDCDISIIPLRVDECAVPEALRKYQWVEYSNSRRDIDLIAALQHAARQRGLFSEATNNVPVVSEIVTIDDRSSDGSAETSIIAPRIFFPRNQSLSDMVSALVLGSASEIVLGFKRDIDKEISKTYGRPQEVHVHTKVEFINNYLLSAESAIYTDRLGAHGYGYTKSLNILVEDRKSFSCADMFQSLDFLCGYLIAESVKTNETFLFEPTKLVDVVGNALENNTTLNKEGMRVVFNQYEAFCYAHGPVVFRFFWGDPELEDKNLSQFGLGIKHLLVGKQ